MKQEEKEILFKDLCARLPYSLKVKCEKYPFPVTVLYAGNIDEVKFRETGGIECIYTIKPYLFPLSSMSDEIIDEIYNNAGVYDIDSSVHIEIGTKFEDLLKVFDILHKHHIDYRNLIEKGLAIDCSNLNIY